MSNIRVPVVLVVEDEFLIGEMVADALNERGFGVHLVAEAGEALAYLASGAPVDVLFTDINLPGSMDGAALAVQARAARPELPVIYASGRWNLLENLRGEPHSMILPKPYSPVKACMAVERLLPPAQSAPPD